MKKETPEKKNRQAKQQKKDERGQRNEKSKGVGKVKLIKGSNLPEREGRDEWESFGHLRPGFLWCLNHSDRFSCVTNTLQTG